MKISEDVYQIVYTSHATTEFSQAMLTSLLEHSRRYNAARGITGVLMHHESFFAQCLEGPANEVNTLLKRIVRDSRHRNVVTVFEQATAVRTFPEWYMGCTEISGSEAIKLSTSTWETLEQTSSGLNSASPGFVLLRSLWEMHSQLVQR